MIFYFLILLFIGSGRSEVQICDVCTCSELSEDVDNTKFFLNIQCSEINRIEHLGDLDKIVWPENGNSLVIEAAFEGLGLSTLGKLPENRHVESLTFSNNIIKTYWPDPFSLVPNLRRLSFSQNDLTEITPDLFTNIEKLEYLDLSYNKIYDFNPLDFKRLTRVRKFNLQSNLLKRIPLDALQPMSSLEELDLSKNSIYDLLLTKNNLVNLKILNLSGNKIRSIVRDSFAEDNNLEFIDLSNNIIEIVEAEAFLPCTNLRELNLAQNNITHSFDLPPTLQVITLRLNTMHGWPRFPTGIKLIDISYNRLHEIYDESVTELNSLENLNIAGNQIKTLNIRNKLPLLLSLDLSFNQLKEIPPSINSEIFPVLHSLILDGNPIERVYFPKKIALESLFMSELNNIRVVEENAFSNIVPRIRDGTADYCFSLTLSNCPSLEEIKVGAFDGTSLCMLDISSNNLTKVSQNLVIWSKLTDGINLQFNPWDCSCDMQWILDDLLPEMIENNSRLLAELRCHSPRGLEGLRFVHFYNWTEKIMCDPNVLNGPKDDYLLLTPNGQKVTSLTLILVGAIIVGILVIIGLMVYLIRNRKKYKVRQAALKRKRQNLQDAKNPNGIHKEQFSALNRM